MRATALHHLSLETNELCLNARRFVSESEDLTEQQQQLSNSWFGRDIRLRDTTAEATGAVAIDFLLDKILTGWIGEEELERICAEIQG